MVRPESTSRSLARSSSTSALAEHHVLAGHPGPADGCGDCADQMAAQRQASGALRGHQRRTRQQVDAILNPYPNGIPAPKGACATCAYDPCVCAATDETVDLILEAEAYGLYDGGIGEEWSQ